MVDQQTLQIDRKEVLRYLGYGNMAFSEVDGRVLAFIEEAISMLKSRCRMRFTNKIFALHVLGEQEASAGEAQTDEVWADRASMDQAPADRAQTGVLLDFGGAMMVKSKSLAVNLKDCQEVVLMAATLGVEADQLISRYSRQDMSRGLIMEAAATAVIEEFCDACQLQLEEELNRQGKTLRPRFSPGYGDFDIAHQKDMTLVLDTARRMGLTLTEGCMLAPSKSVTAVMGVARLEEGTGQSTGSQEKRRCTIKGCEACDKSDCQYRRNR